MAPRAQAGRLASEQGAVVALVGSEPTSDPGHPIPCSRLVEWGGLPSVALSDDPGRDLSDYVGLYLAEEVRAEGVTRSLPAFSRFLDVAALTNGEHVVLASVARDAEVPARTVRDWYDVLQDTMIGCVLPAYRATSRRKAVATGKFYFFDTGVAHSLAGRRGVAHGTPEWGRAVEHRICVELRAGVDYLAAPARLWTWRSLSQLEVDFVLDLGRHGTVGIEVKAGGKIGPRDLRGLRALAEDVPRLRRIVVCGESAPRVTDDGVEILPVEEFLRALWSGQVLSTPPVSPRTGPGG